MTPQDQIELFILNYIKEWTPDEYDHWYFPFKPIMDALHLDRPICRGFCQSLRDRGFLIYGVGFSDDGYTAGGGYAITQLGRDRIDMLLATLTENNS